MGGGERREYNINQEGRPTTTGKTVGTTPRRAHYPTPVHLYLLSTQPGPDRRTYRPFERIVRHTDYDGDDQQMTSDEENSP